MHKISFAHVVEGKSQWSRNSVIEKWGFILFLYKARENCFKQGKNEISVESFIWKFKNLPKNLSMLVCLRNYLKLYRRISKCRICIYMSGALLCTLNRENSDTTFWNPTIELRNLCKHLAALCRSFKSHFRFNIKCVCKMT